MQRYKPDTRLGGVIIFSRDFIIGTALVELYKMSGRHRVKYTGDINAFFDYLAGTKLSRVVLDIPARDFVYLLCAIRRQYPALPVIITRRRHLFSDYITASWFGNIWLRDYDALMAGGPDMPPPDCMAGGCLTGPEEAGACRRCCRGGPGGPQVLLSLRGWLGHRLRERLASRQGVNVILNWLEQGGTAADVGKRLGRSEKLAYHYRWLLMKELGIRNRSLEFIPSVTVSGGEMPAGCSAVCLMQAGCAGDTE